MQGAPPPPPPQAQAQAQQAPPQQPASAAIACVALIGRQNQPLLLRVLLPPAPPRPPPAPGAPEAPAADADDPAQEQQLRFSYVAHCALDALEERVLLGRRAAAAASGGGGGAGAGGGADAFLGLLYPAEEHRVYGYCSATHLKVVLVVAPLPPGVGGSGGGNSGPGVAAAAAAAGAAAAAAASSPHAHADAAAAAAPCWPRDAPLARLCRRLHAVYADAASGPFFVPGAPLGDDPRVLAGVDAALADFSAVVAAGG